VVTRSALLSTAFIAILANPGAAQSPGELYHKACDEGDAYVCNLLGIMYESGKGVTKDLVVASSLYRRACESGELMGCTNLGLMYEVGIGVALDPARAVGLFRVACEGGQQLSCEQLNKTEFNPGVTLSSQLNKVGRVGDAETHEPLSEAIVELPLLGIRTISDARGRFEIENVPLGQHVVQAQRLGYGVLTATLDFPGSSNLVLLLRKGPAGDLDAPGTVEGRVIDGMGNRPLADVDISVLGQRRARTVSNQNGRFRLRNIDPGLVEVRFIRIGYAPRTATLIVQPNRTTEVSATMVTQPIELEAIQVTARPSHLEQNGFFARMEHGRGTLVTPQDMARIDPIIVSDVIRERVPGIRIQYGAGGEARVVTTRASGLSVENPECVMEIFVDGMRQGDEDLDRYNPEQIQAMEIYQGVSTPIQFTSSFNACGVVLLWTRRGA